MELRENSILSTEAKKTMAILLAETFKDYQEHFTTEEAFSQVKLAYKMLCTKEEWIEMWAEFKKLATK